MRKLSHRYLKCFLQVTQQVNDKVWLQIQICGSNAMLCLQYHIASLKYA